MKRINCLLLSAACLLGLLLPGNAAPQYLPGDVTGEGEITAGDARLALRAAVGLENYTKGSREFRAADVTKDGAISAEDARLILRAAVGLETFSDDEEETQKTDPPVKKPEPTTQKIEPTTQKTEPTTQKPELTTKKPELTTQKPEPTTQKPEPTTQKTEPTTQKTEPTTQKTESTTKMPEPTTRKPEPTTRKPEPTTRKPEPTTRKPEPTTRKPEPTTQKPEPTTRKPEPTTQKPEPTTQKPEPTTRKPEPTTRKPEPTTRKPEPTTQKPEPTTEKPEPVTIPPVPSEPQAYDTSFSPHRFPVNGNITDITAICTHCGQPKFNLYVNELKKNPHTYTGFSETKSSGKVTGHDIHISSGAKLLARMAGETLDEKTLVKQFSDELTNNRHEYCNYAYQKIINDQNFCRAGKSTVCDLTEADTKAMTVEELTGIDFLEMLPDVVMVKSPYTTNPIAFDLSQNIKKASIGRVFKITVTVKEESYAKIKNSTDETPLMRAMDQDLRALVRELNHTEDNDGMKLEMKCDQATGKGKLTYYLDAETLLPVAAVYDTDLAMTEKFNFDMQVSGIKMMYGSMTAAVQNQTKDYYFFDSYFDA